MSVYGALHPVRAQSELQLYHCCAEVLGNHDTIRSRNGHPLDLRFGPICLTGQWRNNASATDLDVHIAQAESWATTGHIRGTCKPLSILWIRGRERDKECIGVIRASARIGSVMLGPAYGH
jgi:hypothetical protein